MLTILGEPGATPFCDGVTRRGFLKIGGLAMGGLAMPQLLAAESAAGVRPRSHKAIIMIYLPGGPPHQDMFDLKPEAPSEVSSFFEPIGTNVSGIEICEHFPRMARMMDKLAIIRSIVGAEHRHSGFQCLTGRVKDNQPPGGWPYIGSVVSKFQGAVDPSVSPAAALDDWNRYGRFWNEGRDPGFLGETYAPFKLTDGDAMQDMTLKGVSLERLHDRRALLASFDQFRRDVDQTELMDAIDANHSKAMNILTSSRMVDALDVTKEDPALRERYGYNDKGETRYLDDFLLARRMVEAGARCVTLQFGTWDWHGTYGGAPVALPMLDHGVSTLVEDLHLRGLDKDVSVVVWGEFGRAPHINNLGGRHHWTPVSSALIAGGGMRTGQVIGATDRLAGEVKSRPVHMQEVFATLYHNVGIDLNQAVMHDLTGRPHRLVDPRYEPITELI